LQETAEKIVLAAQGRMGALLAEHLRGEGFTVEIIDWRQGKADVRLPEAAALVICALRLKFPGRKLSEALLFFPPRSAQAARNSGIAKIVYLVPQVRGLADDAGAALRSSIVLMRQSFNATVVSCGFLWGAGGAVEGLRIGPAVVVPGQGWGEVSPILPKDLAGAVTALLRSKPDGEPAGKNGVCAVASTNEAIPLADLIELMRGGRLRLHVPVSLLRSAAAFIGNSLEERALFSGGSLVVANNDIERLISRKPLSLSELARGKAPAWLANLASSP